MTGVADQALTLWGWGEAPMSLAAARENEVYRVEAEGGPFALRLHRQGYRSDAELRSELAWMSALASGGLGVPRPVSLPDGELLAKVRGVQVDALTWLSGDTLREAETGMSVARRREVYASLGEQLARLHVLSDAWTPTDEFVRHAWNRETLLGEVPVWGRFWDASFLPTEDRTLLAKARRRADQLLHDAEGTLDHGLIHADPVRENVLVHTDGVRLIDFDDGGWGYRLFDIATALGKLGGDPDLSALRDSLLTGYRRVRALDATHLPLMLAIRAFTYVGWIADRMGESGAEERAGRIVADARRSAERLLSSPTCGDA